MFQQKLFVNLVKDLFNLFLGLGRSFNIQIIFESEKFLDSAGAREKSCRYAFNFRAQTFCMVVLTQTVLQII